MFARNLSFRLKPNTHSDYTHTMETEVLPLLKKQKGFKEEMTLSNANSVDGVSISLWESKSDAENYNTNIYPQVMKSLEKVIDGTPRLHTFETVTSTYNKVPVTM
jgi:heme-degrading monooxygenase HmoA